MRPRKPKKALKLGKFNKTKPPFPLMGPLSLRKGITFKPPNKKEEKGEFQKIMATKPFHLPKRNYPKKGEKKNGRKKNPSKKEWKKKPL